jgi:hypothetical protein
MKRPHKFITPLLLCVFVVLGFGASTSNGGSRIEDLRKAAEKYDVAKRRTGMVLKEELSPYSI